MRRLCRERLTKLEAEHPEYIRPTPLVGFYPEYRTDPVGFAVNVLGITPWDSDECDSQADILRAVEANNSVTVRSGHKVGKSTSAAILALWYYSCFEDARAILTAPTHRQVQIVLWREVRRLVRRAKKPIAGAESIAMNPSTGLRAEDGRELFGFTTDDPDRFSGISGPHVMYIADEAAGIAEEIFEALEGNRAGGAKLALFGNPTQVSGTFFDSHHRARSVFRCLHIDSQLAAVYAAGIPGIAQLSWCEEKAKIWGVGSALHDVRVRGSFPTQSIRSVIPLGLAQAALERWENNEDGDEKATDPLCFGVDVAREGDDETVITPRRGKRMYRPVVIPGATDGVQVAGHVVQLARDMRRPGEPLPFVMVDEIGYGASVVDQLAYHHHEDVVVVPVNVATTADEDEEFSNLRAQLHYGMRTWLEEGGELPDDDQLLADLLAAEYDFDARGRRRVEEKKAIKKRLSRSPDRADSAQLSVYAGGTPMDANRVDESENMGGRMAGLPGRGFG